MADADPQSRAPRSGFAPLCATIWAGTALVLLGALPGCLNPLPDEQPSYDPQIRDVPPPAENGDPGASGAASGPAATPNPVDEGEPSLGGAPLEDDSQPDGGAPLDAGAGKRDGEANEEGTLP